MGTTGMCPVVFRQRIKDFGELFRTYVAIKADVYNWLPDKQC